MTNFRQSIALGEQWAAVQGILGQSPDEFAATLTDECRSSCDFTICNILVMTTKPRGGTYSELAVACRACTKTCFKDRLVDIVDYADDVNLNHRLASHAQADAGGDPNMYEATAKALEEPKKPSLFAALRRENRGRRPRVSHVTKPDIESERFAGRRVHNLSPEQVSPYL